MIFTPVSSYGFKNIQIDINGLVIYTPSQTFISGTTWQDIAPESSQYDATLYNGPVFNNSTTPYFFQFDGVNDYADYIDSENLGDSVSYTFGGWVNMEQSAGERVFYQRGQDGFGNGFSIAVTKDGSNLVNIYIIANSILYQVTSTTVITSNTWFHIYGSFQYGTPSELKLYINGVSEASISVPNNAALRSSTYGWNLCLANGFVSHQVKVSTFELYNVVLTDAQIKGNYNATKSFYGY
jgi:hypothetical protein